MLVLVILIHTSKSVSVEGVCLALQTHSIYIKASLLVLYCHVALVYNLLSYIRILNK